MFKHRSIESIPTERLLEIRRHLQRKQIAQECLSTSGSLAILYVTQELDRRHAK